MVTYKTFLKNHRLQRHEDRHRLIEKKGINFATQSLDAKNEGGEVHQVISIKPGTLVLNVITKIDVAGPTFGTIDVGYGTVPNYWGNGLRIDSVGYASTLLTNEATIYPPDYIAPGEQWDTEVNIPGAAYGDVVSIQSVNQVDMADISLHGNVYRPDTIKVNLTNLSTGQLSIPTMSILVFINKAPLAINPVLFQERDTIDVTATVDNYDVNLDSGNITIKANVVLLNV